MGRINKQAGDGYYKNVFDNSPFMQIIVDRHSLLIMDANKAAREYWGFPEHCLIGKNIGDIFLQDAALFIDSIQNMKRDRSESVLIRFQRDQNIFFFSVAMNYVDPEEDKQACLNFSDVTQYVNEITSNNALKESEQKLKVILNNLEFVIFQIDKNGIFLILEGCGLERIGVKPQQIIGLSAFDMQDRLPEFTISVRRVLQGEHIQQSLELRGAVYDVTYTPLKNENGSTIGVIGFAEDITDRKRTEEALALSEAKYRMLVENTSDIMFAYDSQGVFTYISKAVNQYGYEVDEIVGQRVIDFIHQEEREHIFEEIKNSLGGIKGNVPRIFRIRVKNGSYIIVEEVGTDIKDETGKVVQITGILRDVTRRKIAEEELRKSEERYRLLVELMPESVVILHNSTIVFANHAFLQLCNFKHQEEVMGKNILEFFHSDFINVSENLILDILNRKLKSITYESKIIASDDKLIDIEVTLSFFMYTDHPSVLFILRDVSDRTRNKELVEKIEQAQEYDKLKTEFFANISHEFKTPLSVIMGTLQLLNLLMKVNESTLEIDEKLNRYFYIMRQNCYRLIRLVNNLIDITKIDSNFYEIKLQNKNIVDVVENIVLSISEYVENKGLTIDLKKENDTIITACDTDKIERIILNLISNAIKFTSLGGKITVKIKRMSDFIRISVIDTGIGIPSDKLDLIFERFRQIDKSMTRNHEGSGIGLSLVKSLVEMHGGNISVKSKYNKGSEFRVDLPVRLISGKEDSFVHSDRLQEIQIEKINIEFSDIYLK